MTFSAICEPRSVHFLAVPTGCADWRITPQRTRSGGRIHHRTHNAAERKCLLAWRTALGPEWKRVQQTWLHSLGNLTLTGYNSEYSDRPFAEKRDMAAGSRKAR